MSTDKHTPNSIQWPLFGPIYFPLTRGYEATIDLIDSDLLSVSWNASACGNRVYAKHGKVYLHRVILSRILERELEQREEVDHIDGNALNNLRSNLRLSTRAQNIHNSQRPSHNTSGHKGVSWHKQIGKWRAYIKVNQRYIHLGLFETKEEAFAAYTEAARLYFGEFARPE